MISASLSGTKGRTDPDPELLCRRPALHLETTSVCQGGAALWSSHVFGRVGIQNMWITRQADLIGLRQIYDPSKSRGICQHLPFLRQVEAFLLHYCNGIAGPSVQPMFACERDLYKHRGTAHYTTIGRTRTAREAKIRTESRFSRNSRDYDTRSATFRTFIASAPARRKQGVRASWELLFR
jgi:hypothetical protein